MKSVSLHALVGDPLLPDEINGVMSSKITYRQQYTRCGKERCRKCKEGVGHGPYWYAYWSENGRTISKYIGIRLNQYCNKVLKKHV